MKITFLYDRQDQESDTIHQHLIEQVTVTGVTIDSIDVSAKPVAQCIGCFKCWTKTPGLCIHKNDAGGDLITSICNAEYLVVISRILWGGYSVPIKSYIDRILPLLHPYFKKFNGEMHHMLRYHRYPMTLMVGYGARSGEEEQCFRAYTTAVRDQTSRKNDNGVFILDNDTTTMENCINWLGKEIAA